MIGIEDLYILHLSDLHIGKCLNKPLYRLIDDVETMLRNVKHLVIVVTGDFACGGKVSESSELILFFFQMLKNHIPASCRVEGVVLTPGNHDVVRPDRSNVYHNQTYKHDSSDYDRLVKSIRHVFLKDKDAHEVRFGVRRYGVTRIDCGYHKVVFVSFDTSWHAKMEELQARIAADYKNISDKRRDALANQIFEATKRYAEKQSRAIAKMYKKCTGRKDLTIAISHFPLTWMVDNYQRIRDFLYEKGLKGVDIWLCGHAHAAQLYYNTDNYQSTTMLMTGIGRSDYKKNDSEVGVGGKKVQLQRYSLYQISFERNVCSVQVRKSKFGREFERDGEFYVPEDDRYNFSCLPLRSHVPGGFIRLNAASKGDAKGLFVDYTALEGLRDIGLRMVIFNERIGREIEKQTLLLKYGLCSRGYSSKIVEERLLTRKFGWQVDYGPRWRKNCTDCVISNDMFRDFLKMIGGALIEVFTRSSIVEMPDKVPYAQINAFEKIGWRVHFRIYRGEPSRHSNVIISDEYVDCVRMDDSRPAKIVPWGGLLERAFGTDDKCLIYSVAGVDNHIPTGWSDFMTAIPVFKGNEKQIVLNRGKNLQKDIQNRPLLTYAVSMKISNHEEAIVASRMLYILEYLQLNHVVSRQIQSFLNIADIDAGKVVEAL